MLIAVALTVSEQSKDNYDVCYSNGQYQIYSLLVQSTGYHTNAFGFNLRKTNAANEGWLADYFMDVKPWEVMARPIALLILTA